MKAIYIGLLTSSIFLIGCNRNKEMLLASDLARALHIVPVMLELPEESYTQGEYYFFFEEKSDGRSDWFSAFKTPKRGGTVKLLANTKANQIMILVDDEDIKTTATVTLQTSEYGRIVSWPGGVVKPDNYILLFSDSREEGVVSFGEESINEAKIGSWVQYTLVRASDVPEEAPVTIQRNIQRSMNNYEGDEQFE